MRLPYKVIVEVMDGARLKRKRTIVASFLYESFARRFTDDFSLTCARAIGAEFDSIRRVVLLRGRKKVIAFEVLR